MTFCSSRPLMMIVTITMITTFIIMVSNTNNNEVYASSSSPANNNNCSTITNQSVCQNSTICQWNSNRNECTLACNQHTNMHDCFNDFLCALNYISGACVANCQYANLTNATQCTAYSDGVTCSWSNSRSACFPRCRDNSFPSTCASNPTCRWLWDLDMCVSSCADTYTTAASCNSNSECSWSAVTLQCGPKCGQNTNATFCKRQEASCSWNKFTSQCELACTQLYFSEAPCNSDSSCFWNPAISTCESACHTLQPKDCSLVSSGRCMLNSTVFTMYPQSCIPYNASAVPTTPQADCSMFSTPLSCVQAPDASCSWNPDPKNSGCIISCRNRYSTPNACGRGETHCFFDAVTNRCTDSCAVLTNETCNLNGRCIYDPSSGLCNYRCEIYHGSSNCNSRSNCAWNSQRDQCEGTCAKLSSAAACRTNTLCKFREPEAVCAPTCPFLAYDAASCTQLPGCYWNTIFDVCFTVVNNSATTTTATTSSVPAATTTTTPATTSAPWTPSPCTSLYPDQRDCEADSACLWDPLDQLCVQSCESRMNLTTCSGPHTHGLCQWNPNRNECALACDRLQSYSECYANTLCRYNHISRTCFTDCQYANLANSTQCSAYAGGAICAWSNAHYACFPLCVTNIYQSTCAANPTCRWLWTARRCAPSCTDSYTAASTCNADRDCLWSAVALECRPDCMQNPNATFCKRQESTCLWNSFTSQCGLTCPQRYFSDAPCNSDYSCSWNHATRICESACHTLQLKDCSLVSSGRCMLNSTSYPQACIPYNASAVPTTPQANCSMFSTPLSCVQAPDASCSWNSGSCVVSCRNRHLSPQSCNGDFSCIFDSDTNRCTDLCAVLTNETCNLNGRCIYDPSSGTCNRRCEVRYLSSNTCNMNPNCAWNSQRDQCQGTCSKLSSAAACRTNTLCKFLEPEAVCAPTCPFLAYDAASCTQLPGCYWNTIFDVCFTVVNNSATTTTTTAAAPATTSSVPPATTSTMPATTSAPWTPSPCTSLYPDQRDCEADSACQWDPLDQLCVQSCKSRMNLTACSGPHTHGTHGLCQWNPNRNECALACELIPTPNGDSLACLNNPLCEFFYVPGANWRCRTACQYANLADASSCTSYSPGNCEWSSAHSMCFPKCNSRRTGLGCQQLPNCWWNQTEQTCQPACSALSTNSSTCASSSVCFWNSTSASCTQDCGSYTNSRSCFQDRACKWNGDYCVRSCMYRYYDATSCNSDSSCSWNPAINTCQPACSDLWAPSCAFLSSGRCIVDVHRMCVPYTSSVVPATPPPQANCSMFTTALSCTMAPKASCSWDPTKSKCVLSCRNRALNPQACMSQITCIFDSRTERCTDLCPLLDADTCSLNGRCEYDYSGSNPRCRTRCAYRHFSATSCNSDSSGQCIWDSASATCETTCNDLTEPNCKKTSLCSWSQQYNYCLSGCTVKNPFLSACEQDATNCYWNTIFEACMPLPNNPVMTTTTAMTTTTPATTSAPWTPSPCTSLYPDQRECEADSACLWDPLDQLCVQSCESRMNLTACSGPHTHGLCQWNPNSNTCRLALPTTAPSPSTTAMPATTTTTTSPTAADCSSIISEPSCIANRRNCTWDSQYLSCRRRCATFNTLTSCNTDSAYCQWILGTCVPKCSSNVKTACELLDGPCVWDHRSSNCVLACPLRFAALSQSCVNASDTAKCYASTNKTACDLSNNCRSPLLTAFPGAPVCSDNTCNFNDATECNSHADDLNCYYFDEGCKAVYCNSKMTASTCADYTAIGRCIWDSSMGPNGQCVPGNPSTTTAAPGTPTSTSTTTLAVTTTAPSPSTTAMPPTTSAPWTPSPCTSLYPDQRECQADSACLWDPLDQLCVQSCESRMNLTACSGPHTHGLCQWNPNSNTCRLALPTTAPSPSTTAMPATTSAPWTPSPCTSLYPDQRECEADSACLWDPLDQLCVQSCESRMNLTACSGPHTHGQSAVCTWSPSDSKCYTNCNFLSTDQNSCNKQVDCQFIGTKCVTKCNVVKSVQYCAEQSPYCTFDQNRFQCRTTCPFSYTTVQQCEQDSSCVVVDGRSCLSARCRAFTSENACSNAGFSTSCYWDTTSAQCTPFDCQLASNQTQCTTGVAATRNCFWNFSLNGCLGIYFPCTSHANQQSCTSDFRCEWFPATPNGTVVKSTCAPKCSSHKSAQTCASTVYANLCFWNEEAGFCGYSCPAHYGRSSRASCNANSQCEFNTYDSICQNKRCTSRNKIRCLSNPGCIYDYTNERCYSPCRFQNGNQTGCFNQAQVCTWSQTRSTCFTSCQLFSYSSCDTESGSYCMVPFGTYPPTCQTACNNANSPYECSLLGPYCTFKNNNNNNSTCQLQCPYKYSNMTKCAQDPSCHVDASGQYCLSKQCDFNTSEQCSLHSACNWDSKYGVCEIFSCFSAKNESTCSSTGFASRGCVWIFGQPGACIPTPASSTTSAAPSSLPSPTSSSTTVKPSSSTTTSAANTTTTSAAPGTTTSTTTMKPSSSTTATSTSAITSTAPGTTTSTTLAPSTTNPAVTSMGVIFAVGRTSNSQLPDEKAKFTQQLAKLLQVPSSSLNVTLDSSNATSARFLVTVDVSGNTQQQNDDLAKEMLSFNSTILSELGASSVQAAPNNNNNNVTPPSSPSSSKTGLYAGIGGGVAGLILIIAVIYFVFVRAPSRSAGDTEQRYFQADINQELEGAIAGGSEAV